MACDVTSDGRGWGFDSTGITTGSKFPCRHGGGSGRQGKMGGRVLEGGRSLSAGFSCSSSARALLQWHQADVPAADGLVMRRVCGAVIAPLRQGGGGVGGHGAGGESQRERLERLRQRRKKQQQQQQQGQGGQQQQGHQQGQQQGQQQGRGQHKQQQGQGQQQGQHKQQQQGQGGDDMCEAVEGRVLGMQQPQVHKGEGFGGACGKGLEADQQQEQQVVGVMGPAKDSLQAQEGRGNNEGVEDSAAWELKMKADQEQEQEQQQEPLLGSVADQEQEQREQQEQLVGSVEAMDAQQRVKDEEDKGEEEGGVVDGSGQEEQQREGQRQQQQLLRQLRWLRREQGYGQHEHGEGGIGGEHKQQQQQQQQGQWQQQQWLEQQQQQQKQHEQCKEGLDKQHQLPSSRDGVVLVNCIRPSGDVKASSYSTVSNSSKSKSDRRGINMAMRKSQDQLIATATGRQRAATGAAAVVHTDSVCSAALVEISMVLVEPRVKGALLIRKPTPPRGGAREAQDSSSCSNNAAGGLHHAAAQVRLWCCFLCCGYGHATNMGNTEGWMSCVRKFVQYRGGLNGTDKHDVGLKGISAPAKGV